MGTSISVDLTSNVTTTYDNTKTTLFGRVKELSYGGASVGPNLSRFVDVFTDTGLAPIGPAWLSDNNRLYVLVSLVATAAQIALYDFDLETGSTTYVGRIAFALPNLAVTTHTARALRVANDSSDSLGNWRIYICTTGSVLINGGVFCINKVGKSSFTQVLGATIPLATSTDQQAVYQLQNPALMGSLHTDTACAGMIYEQSTGRIYAHHGIAATHQYVCHDVNVASLVYSSTSVNVTVATPGKVQHPAHGYVAGDPVVFISGTLPTGLVIGTPYFVKSVTANDYELSLTTGGVSINTTGTAGTATVGRAFGQTGSGWLFRTGNLPALSGTILLADCEDFVIPTNSPLNGPILNGQPCVSINTTTNLYLGKLSELQANASQSVTVSVASPGVVSYPSHPFLANDTVTFSAGTLPTGLSVGTIYYVKNPLANTFELSLTSGGASINTTGVAGTAMLNRTPLIWPSLTTSNLLGSTNETIAPVASLTSWDSSLDDVVIVTNATRFLTKQLENNHLRFKFGNINTNYYEGLNDPRILFGMASVSGMTRKNGWLFITGLSTNIGQRGLMLMDMSTDYFYDKSYIITPVISLNGVNITNYSHYWEQYDWTGDTFVYYRTSGFDSSSGGWVDLINRSQLNNIHVTDKIQFKIAFTVQSENFSSAPILKSLNLNYDTDYGISPYWEYSHDKSSTGVPTRIGFRLKAAYTAIVPKLYFRAYDLSDSLLTNHNTVDHTSHFEYSSDGGTTWLPLGVVPNVEGTLLRYTFTSPPGVDIRPGLMEI